MSQKNTSRMAVKVRPLDAWREPGDAEEGEKLVGECVEYWVEIRCGQAREGAEGG